MGLGMGVDDEKVRQKIWGKGEVGAEEVREEINLLICYELLFVAWRLLELIFFRGSIFRLIESSFFSSASGTISRISHQTLIIFTDINVNQRQFK